MSDEYNMKNKKYFSVILLYLLLFTINAIWSQTQLKNSIIANGGQAVNSEGNRIVGTIGQALIGRINNQSNSMKVGFWEQVGSLITDVDAIDIKLLPNQFYLYQNYPNPFNPSTKIRYTIPAVGTSLMKFVQLKVYDVLGNEVATLVNEEKSAGSYEVEFQSAIGGSVGSLQLASGIYFYKIQAGSFVETKKMILLR